MSLLKIIDEELAKKQLEKENKQPSGFITPSSFGKCYRSQYWQRKGEKASNPIDARTLRVFAVGNLFHDFVQKYIPNAQSEISIVHDDVRGRADVVTEDTVYDIKSQHSKGFFYMNTAGYDVKKEKETAWLQVAWYAMELNKPKICLVFISKDDLCINEYVDLTEKWVEKVNNELFAIRSNWAKNELPKGYPRAYGGNEGKYCPYLDKCLSLGYDCIKKTVI